MNPGTARGAIAMQTVLLLLGCNVFMTFAWYAHLRNLAGVPGGSPRW